MIIYDVGTIIISVFQKKKAELQRSYVLGPRSHK